MYSRMRLPIAAAAALMSLGAFAGAQAQQATMTFFLTSAGPGKGGDLGGIEGADRLASSWRRRAEPAARLGAPI